MFSWWFIGGIIHAVLTKFRVVLTILVYVLVGCSCVFLYVFYPSIIRPFYPSNVRPMQKFGVFVVFYVDGCGTKKAAPDGINQSGKNSAK